MVAVVARFRAIVQGCAAMAYRDSSQGFGFVYMDLSKLLKKDGWMDDGPLPAFEGKSINFNKDSNFTKPSKDGAFEKTQAPNVVPFPTPVGVSTEAKTPIEQIRQNLDRLQTLHHRIHVMLEELNQLNGKKKDPKGDS